MTKEEKHNFKVMCVRCMCYASTLQKVKLLCSSTVTYGMVSSNMYYYTKVMSQLFLDTPLSAGNHATFSSLSTMEDFWKVNLAQQTPSTFSLGVTQRPKPLQCPALHRAPPSLKINLNTIFFNVLTKCLQLSCRQFTEGPFLNGMYWEVWYNNKSLPDNQSLIYYENLLLGVPRLRQVKVHNQSCTIHRDLRKEVQECFNIYTPSNEATHPFGPKNGTACVEALHVV